MLDAILKAFAPDKLNSSTVLGNPNVNKLTSWMYEYYVGMNGAGCRFCPRYSEYYNSGDAGEFLSTIGVWDTYKFFKINGTYGSQFSYTHKEFVDFKNRCDAAGLCDSNTKWTLTAPYNLLKAEELLRPVWPLTEH